MASAVRRTAALKALLEALRGAHQPGTASAGRRMRAVPRMLAQGFSGRYPHLSKGRIGVSALALVYVLSPIDLVPELLVPILGLGDDALVVAWLAGTLLAETDTFLRWESDRDQVVVGEVITER